MKKSLPGRGASASGPWGGVASGGMRFPQGEADWTRPRQHHSPSTSLHKPKRGIMAMSRRNHYPDGETRGGTRRNNPHRLPKLEIQNSKLETRNK